MTWTIESTKAFLTQRAEDLSSDPCSECVVIPMADAAALDEQARDALVCDANMHGMFRRCQDCATRLIHPWLADVDAERACAWLNEHHQEDAFVIDELKVLL